MTYDEAIKKVHSVADELAERFNDDKDAIKKALKERRQTDSDFAEAAFQYEKFHRVCDESPRQ